MKKNVIQIKSGMTINDDAIVNMWKRVYYIEFCFMQLQSWGYLTSITDNSVIKCDELINGDVKGKLHGDETKTITTNFNDKS